MAQPGIEALPLAVPLLNVARKKRRTHAVVNEGRKRNENLPDMRAEVPVLHLYPPPATIIDGDRDGDGNEGIGDPFLTGGINNGGLRNKNCDGEKGGSSSIGSRNRLLPNAQDGMVAFGAALDEENASVFSRRVVLLKKRIIK